MDYLTLAGLSIAGVLGISILGALAVGRGNPVTAFSVWMAWVKKYWMYMVVAVSALFAGLVAVASSKKVRKERAEAEKKAVEVDGIKEKLQEVNTSAKVEIGIAKAKDAAKKEELEKVKRIEDPMERRKRLAEMLTVIFLLFLAGCAAREAVSYVSALPKPIDTDSYVRDAQTSPEFSVPSSEGCGFDTMPLPSGVLITDTGDRISLPGGVLISDCKAEELILYKSSAERFYAERNQLALVYRSLDQSCRQVESMYREELEASKNPDLWEQVDFEAGFIAGAGMCIGIDYAIRQNQEH